MPKPIPIDVEELDQPIAGSSGLTSRRRTLRRGTSVRRPRKLSAIRFQAHSLGGPGGDDDRAVATLNEFKVQAQGILAAAGLPTNRAAVWPEN